MARCQCALLRAAGIEEELGVEVVMLAAGPVPVLTCPPSSSREGAPRLGERWWTEGCRRGRRPVPRGRPSGDQWEEGVPLIQGAWFLPVLAGAEPLRAGGRWCITGRTPTSWLRSRGLGSARAGCPAGVLSCLPPLARLWARRCWRKTPWTLNSRRTHPAVLVVVLEAPRQTRLAHRPLS